MTDTHERRGFLGRLAGLLAGSALTVADKDTRAIITSCSAERPKLPLAVSPEAESSEAYLRGLYEEPENWAPRGIYPITTTTTRVPWPIHLDFDR